MLVKPQATSGVKIKVVGIGGAGGNAVNNMIKNYDIEGVEFIAINTEAQSLSVNTAEVKLQIGTDLTRGLGSGGNPQVGKKAAEESIDMIHEHMAGAELVFITAGMGGGTGTGAAPVIAGIAKNLGALTIAIVEKPFHFEGKRRMETALTGISDIKDKVDTLIIIPNQKLFDIGEKNLSFLDALKKVDDVLAQAVKSISQLITQTGLINLDFADIKSIMSNAGTALMGIGTGTGEHRAEMAVKNAINSPLLEFSIKGATGVILNIVGSKDLSMNEVGEAAQIIQREVSPDCNIAFGASIDPELSDEIQVTVIATGFDVDQQVQVETTTITDSYSNHGHQTAHIPAGSRMSNANTSGTPVNRYQEKEDTAPTNPVQEYVPHVAQKQTLKTKVIKAEENDTDEYDTPAFLRRKQY
jgi:cell division protein FtsZ